MNSDWMDGWIPTRCTGRQCSPVMRLPTGQSLQHARWSDDATKTVHGPPVQARVAAAYRAVPAARTMVLAHMVMNRGGNAKQNRGSRHGSCQRWAGKAKQGRCSKQPADEVAGTGLVQWRLVEGVRWCWPLGRPAQTYPTVSLPTYRLCLSLSIPTPLICKKSNLAPTYFFVLFLLPSINRLLTPFTVSVRLTYPVS